MQPQKASPTATLAPRCSHTHIYAVLLSRAVLTDEKYLQVLLPCIAQCSSKQGISLPHSSNTLFFAGRLFFLLQNILSSLSKI